ncbi:sensor histidine kinase [Nonomuraea sp. LPB2021202275-12-8]|uniref:sensor histidine kinase n=1 Tax=Nonomuraea sp. LPB2021202275-12-8 TaxID=3120159 RepID=UPI00300CAC60
MGSPVGARAESAWLRSYPFWDAYFAIVLAATVVGIVVDTGAPASEAVAAVLLLLLALAYVGWGRKAVQSAIAPAAASRFYAAAMLVLFTAADLIEPVAAIALSALVPMAFMSLRLPHAVVLMLALFTAPTINFMTVTGVNPLLILAALAIGVSGSALLGVFIDRLSVQNHERARLIEELDRTRGALAAVSRQAGVLAERERLAGDIHDTLAQGFGAIIMLLQSAESGSDRHVALAMRTARENLAETRALIAALTPPALDGASLEEALARLATGFGLPVALAVTGGPAALPAETQVVLVRAAQEGLANVRKHARASAARLALDHSGGWVRLTVADDGRGFTPAPATASGTDGPDGAPSDETGEANKAGGVAGAGGYGLRVMRSRVARLGGTVTVDSAPGRGTTIVVEVPCSR